MKSFQDLGLSAPLLRALADLGFEQPSTIQEQAIPLLLEGHTDLIGLAQTGTGKTAAFGLPLLERIDPDFPHTQALILAPTRELGQQIAEQIVHFSKYQPKIKAVAVYGGAPIQTQIKALRQKPQVIIATPGRLLDMIRRRAVDLEHLEIAILDEADEMLNMGFREELDSILATTPAGKMTWLFSATMPGAIKEMVGKYMHQPKEVRISPKEQVNVNIEHLKVTVAPNNKGAALARFMDLEPDLRGVAFCRTKRDTQNLAETLLEQGYKADALHGDLSQPQRDRVMKRFKAEEIHLLVATDVAARGIDVNDLSHIFHLNIPDDFAYYTHRSGRTARAGKKGISLSILGPREHAKLNRLQKELGIRIAEAQVPRRQDLLEQKVQQWAQAVLETPAKKGLPKSLLTEAEIILGNLSREELISKVLQLQLAPGKEEGQDDLNWKGKTGGSAHSGPKRGGPGKRHYKGEGPGKRNYQGDGPRKGKAQKKFKDKFKDKNKGKRKRI